MRAVFLREVVEWGWKIQEWQLSTPMFVNVMTGWNTSKDVRVDIIRTYYDPQGEAICVVAKNWREIQDMGGPERLGQMTILEGIKTYGMSCKFTQMADHVIKKLGYRPTFC